MSILMRHIPRFAGMMSSCHRLMTVGGHLQTKVHGGPSVRQMSSSSGVTVGISPASRAVLDTRTSIPILNSTISYLDTKQGDNVVLFLHGNPTAAFLWRNIIPHVQPIARCVAPDLIGMGHSGKLDITYKYAEQYEYLCAWIEAMNFPGKLTIVCHDWGSGLGFHWCNQHRERVRSIVHMESLVCPVPSWDLFPEGARNVFKALRSEAGEEMVLEKNFFVERLLPGSVMRKLTDEEMAEYRAPYAKDKKTRLPTLTWPREIPVMTDGPDDVVKFATDYYNWLSTSDDVPKLFIDAKPGFFSPGIRKLVAEWPNHKVVEAKGLHFLQEDSPDDIGQHIKDFLKDVYAK